MNKRSMVMSLVDQELGMSEKQTAQAVTHRRAPRGSIVEAREAIESSQQAQSCGQLGQGLPAEGEGESTLHR